MLGPVKVLYALFCGGSCLVLWKLTLGPVETYMLGSVEALSCLVLWKLMLGPMEAYMLCSAEALAWLYMLGPVETYMLGSVEALAWFFGSLYAWSCGN